MVRSLNSDRNTGYLREENERKKRVSPVGMTVGQGNQEAVLTKKSMRTSRMSFSRVIFMVMLIAGMTAALIFYIKLQTDVTNTSREIAEIERELTEAKAQNDAAYNEINDSISLEEVRDKAINDLGMKAADRDQVVIYSGEEKDSVNQVGKPGSN